MNNPDLIVVEPDAPEESHREAMLKAVREATIAKLLQRKKS